MPKMSRQAGVVLIAAAAIALTFPAELQAATAPANASLVVSANVTGSLGNLCSSQAGILSFLQGATANQSGASLANLNISIPANLTNSAAVQEIAQVSKIQHVSAFCLTCSPRRPTSANSYLTRACTHMYSCLQMSVLLALLLLADRSHARMVQIAWEYIYSYPLPVLAKTVASVSANGTAINTFHSKSNHLTIPADNSLTPNHDTIYSQAWLDLSQVNSSVHCDLMHTCCNGIPSKSLFKLPLQ